MLVDCPAFLGGDGAVRCGLPAEVQARYTAGSTAGPLECVKIRCPRGHWFNGPVEFLSMPQSRSGLPATADVIARSPFPVTEDWTVG